MRMRPRVKVTTTVVDVDQVKEYFCFVCDARSTEKGLPLLVSETTYSHICLGQKLQEILGEKFIVLITSNDTICWNCAEEINWVDKCEIKLDIAKENILNQISKKYRKVEMCLENESNSNHIQAEKATDFVEKTAPAEVPKLLQFPEEPKSYIPPSSPSQNTNSTYTKKKKFPCSVCHKFYATAAAAGAHMAKVHRSHFSCEYCHQVLSTDKRYKAHMALHEEAKELKHESSKLLNCVSCGFKTMNTEVYCRHVCNSAILSLTCMTCKKRYVDSNISKEQTLNFQCQQCTKTKHQKENVQVKKIEQIQQATKSVSDNSKSPEKADLHTEMPEFFKPPQTDDNEHVIQEEEILEPQVEISLTEKTNQNVEETIIEMPTDSTSEVQVQEETTEDGDMMNDMIVSEETEIISERQDTLEMNDVHVSFLKCTNCSEEFEINQLASHQCFAREVVEFAEVERETSPAYMSVPFFKPEKDINSSEAVITHSPKGTQRRRRIPKIPAQENSYININNDTTKMHCKTCGAEFKTIGLMRHHWDLTGHTREVSTTTIELNKIKDKNRQTEKTFKVVKQNFNIRAYVPGQNDDEIKRSEEMHTNCIVRVKKDISVEDFIRMKDGRECETCGILFGSEDLLKEHLRISCLTCVTCNVPFLDNKLLKKHYEYTGHANRIIAPKQDAESLLKEEEPVEFHHCHICSKTFYSRFILGKHLQKHYRGTSKGACHYCQMEFEDKSQIQQHVLESHGAQLYKCQHCDRTFLSESVRNRHQLKHKTNNTEYSCKICKIKFKSQQLLMVHKDKVHRTTYCRICGKLISNLQSLRRHEKRHFYEKGLQCDLCGKLFRNKAALISHSRIHSGEVQFECKTCGLGFKTSNSLEEHQIVHIKKEYTCPKCSIDCPSKMYFWMHTKLHEAPYKCTVCGRKFRELSLLAVHRRKHWRVRPYQCPYCIRAFSVPATLRRHINVHTRAYPHRCVLCKKGFLTKYAFHKHLDTVHSVKQTQPRKIERKIPSLSLNATDEDLFHAADTLISDDTIMFNDYQQKDVTVEQVSSSDLITNEVVVETTELFDEILT